MSGVEGLLLDPLLGVAGKTGLALYKSAKKLRNAPKEFHELLNEVQELRNLISAAQDLRMEEDDLPGLSEAVSKAKEKLLEIDSMVAYQLTKPLNVEEVNRAAWARKSKDIKKLLEDLRKSIDNITAHAGISNLARASKSASTQSHHFEVLSEKLDQQHEQLDTFNVELSQLTLMTSTRHVEDHNIITLLGDQRQLLTGLFSRIEQSTETQRRLVDCLEGPRAENSALSLLPPNPSRSRSNSSASSQVITSQSSRTFAESSSSSSLRFTMIRNNDNECPRACRCACHKPQRFQTPGPARRWIGSLQMHCSGISWLRPTCTIIKCKRTVRTSAVVQYTLPVWIASRMVAAWYKSSPLTEPELLFKVPRIYQSQLYYFSQEGDIESIYGLLSSGEALLHDLDPVTGMNALAAAINFGQYEALTFLLSHGANLEQEDFAGLSARDTALVMYLRGKRIGAPVGGLESCINIDDAIDDAGFTPLHRIVCDLSPEDLEIKPQTHPELLDVADSNGKSPLYWAGFLGNVDAVKLLLKYEANIALASISDSTVLHVCWSSHEIPKLVLESEQAVLHKGLCNRRNKYGNCPWHLCRKGDVLRLFIQHECDLSLRDGERQTALHLAMDSDYDISFSEALMVPRSAKIDLDARDRYGCTAHELFYHYFATKRDREAPEGMARRNLLRYVKRLQNGGSDAVIFEEEESSDESYDGESYDGERCDEEGYGDENSGDESSEDDSDEEIFEDAVDHSQDVPEIT